MTNDFLQELATFVLVAGAALYVVRRGWAALHPEAAGGGGCGSGGCGSCPSNQAAKPGTEPNIQVVSIGLSPARPKKTL